MTLFETTTYIFKQIDPAKKYAEFTYQELTIEQLNSGDCQKGNIIEIDGIFYLYAGEKVNYLSVKTPAKILLKQGKKIISEKLA